MSKETLIAIGAGVLSAISAMTLFGRTPGALIFVYLASLPLFMAGLSAGPRAATIGGAVGFMVAGLLGGSMAAGVFGLMQALPAWLVVRQSMLQRPAGAPGGQPKRYPAGHTLCWLTILAGTLLAVAAVASLSDDRTFSTVVTSNLDHVFKAIAPELDEVQRTSIVGVMTPMFPGAVGVSWVLMTIVNATLAQGILVRMGHNLRPSPAYAGLELPQWMSWPLLGSAALALLGSGEIEYTGRNLAMVMAVPYFFLGLTVIHTWARRLAFTGLILASFYLVLLLSGWMTLVVAGLGMLEQWRGLRGEAPGPTSGGPPGRTE
ncbi:MAG: DUF2232 domain-containing protein [Proteobacteria bacterium]|nr:DUF2232 domain-containing protein [Pseudomonadota bacterium]